MYEDRHLWESRFKIWLYTVVIGWPLMLVIIVSDIDKNAIHLKKEPHTISLYIICDIARPQWSLNQLLSAELYW